jgi:putative transposase
MPHTYIANYIHLVFSTKGRRDLLIRDSLPKVWAYIGGIARTNQMKALTVGGTSNHVHALLSLPPTMPIAKAAQLIKAGSSKWIRENKLASFFAWQENYSGFSVSVSLLDRTIAYIENREAHHSKRSFDSEIVAFLKKHRVEFDSEFVFG